VSLREIFISWWFFFWTAVSLFPFIMGIKSINKNNYETISDKYKDKVAWSTVWVIFEIIFIIIILVISKLLKFI